MSLHGGLITKHPLCYTKDGRLLLAPCGIDIRIYSARSGDHIATLRGHDAEVTSVVQDTSSDKLVRAGWQLNPVLLLLAHVLQ